MANSQAASASALSAAQADADQSRLAAQQAQPSAQQADADKAAMRVRLSEQLNKILQTRDSARGLIVSMSDVLFDTGKYSLKPGAREKLAKVAGILLAYPGLNIEVGGYTDNVGGDQMNQTLSENRAGSVRDYLVQQGVATSSGQRQRLWQHPGRWPRTITLRAGSRTGEWSFSYPAKPSATRSMRKPEACSKGKHTYSGQRR